MREKNTDELLLSTIIDSIEDIKAENIVLLDLCNIENSVCRYFVICDANSNTQVSAIARSVEKKVSKILKEKPWHTEGLQNAEWVLIDYISIVVHVFQKPIREHYNLEALWGDAKVTRLSDN